MNITKTMHLLALALMCLGANAQTTTFKYTATEKLPRFEEIQYFVGATGLVSHDWDAATGEGTVVYEGTVTELGSCALQWQTPMTALEIPEGVTTLGFQSVQCCANLSSVSLPKSLKYVKNMAFYYTGFANGKFIIDDLAWWCSIQFEAYSSNPLNYAKHIYKDKDTEITDLVIPEGVTSIGVNAFYHVEGIKSVTFPESLTSIGSAAFYSTGLETVTIPKGVTEIGGSAFERCGNLKTVTIPEGVTKIGSSAFAYSGLTELTLPSTIKEMSQSFYGCENLAKLNLTDGITDLGGSFYSLPALKEVHVPGSVKILQYSDFNRCDNLETVTIAEGVEEVAGFNSCNNLKSVTIPSTASKVFGFRDCPNLTSVTCMAIEPPYMSYTIPYGKGMSMEGRTLYVPALNQSAYKEAKYWQEFPTIEALDVVPENMHIRDELHLTLPATLSDVKPSVKLLHDNDPKYGVLTVDGEGSMRLSRFSLHVDNYMQYRQGDRALNHSSLMNNVHLSADSVVVDLWLYGWIWAFVSLPFDWRAGDVEPFADGQTDWVIYTYDGRKRADGEMNDTWVRMQGDDVVKAGQGFIVQAQRRGTDNRVKYDVALRIKAINNANKNNLFTTADVTRQLTVYDSEFAHNRSWNFIGNPYPCYFDTRYMDITAPITVRNMGSNSYVAYRPGDDDYVLCPGEGFFVQCPVDKQTIVFSEEGRQTNRDVRVLGVCDTPLQTARSTSPNTRAKSPSNRTIFNLNISDGTTSDRTRIVINEQATLQYEQDKDASKFFATDAAVPQLYTEADGISYAINERPLADGTVSLCASAGTERPCTITLANTVSGYEVTLEDKAEGTTVNLTDGNGYTFPAGARQFVLHISNESTGMSTVRTDSATDGIYTIGGVKVETPAAKGFYIERNAEGKVKKVMLNK